MMLEKHAIFPLPVLIHFYAVADIERRCSPFDLERDRTSSGSLWDEGGREERHPPPVLDKTKAPDYSQVVQEISSGARRRDNGTLRALAMLRRLSTVTFLRPCSISLI
jgi:hypothetical protein